MRQKFGKICLEIVVVIFLQILTRSGPRTLEKNRRDEFWQTQLGFAVFFE